MNEKAKPIKVKAQTKAWATGDHSIDVIMRGLEKKDDGLVIEGMIFSGNERMVRQGWVIVGVATIEVEILPVSELQSQQLATLTAQLEAERADSQLRQNAIMDRISKLQAVGYTRHDPMTDIDADCPF